MAAASIGEIVANRVTHQAKRDIIVLWIASMGREYAEKLKVDSEIQNKKIDQKNQRLVRAKIFQKESEKNDVLKSLDSDCLGPVIKHNSEIWNETARNTVLAARIQSRALQAKKNLVWRNYEKKRGNISDEDIGHNHVKRLSEEVEERIKARNEQKNEIILKLCRPGRENTSNTIQAKMGLLFPSRIGFGLQSPKVLINHPDRTHLACCYSPTHWNYSPAALWEVGICQKNGIVIGETQNYTDNSASGSNINSSAVFSSYLENVDFKKLQPKGYTTYISTIEKSIKEIELSKSRLEKLEYSLKFQQNELANIRVERGRCEEKLENIDQKLDEISGSISQSELIASPTKEKIGDNFNSWFSLKRQRDDIQYDWELLRYDEQNTNDIVSKLELQFNLQKKVSEKLQRLHETLLKEVQWESGSFELATELRPTLEYFNQAERKIGQIKGGKIPASPGHKVQECVEAEKILNMITHSSSSVIEIGTRVNVENFGVGTLEKCEIINGTAICGVVIHEIELLKSPMDLKMQEWHRERASNHLRELEKDISLPCQEGQMAVWVLSKIVTGETNGSTDFFIDGMLYCIIGPPSKRSTVVTTLCDLVRKPSVPFPGLDHSARFVFPPASSLRRISFSLRLSSVSITDLTRFNSSFDNKPRAIKKPSRSNASFWAVVSLKYDL
eukprot:UC4_evm4s1353